MLRTDPVNVLAGPAYILFSLCCIQCHQVQHMSDIPPRVSEEELPWVNVTPYHPNNSVNLPRHLLHSTLHLLLGGDGLGHLYLHYKTIGDNCPPCRMPFAQRNVIDNELPHRTINCCSLYQNINNFTICNGTFLSNSFFASIQ